MAFGGYGIPYRDLRKLRGESQSTDNSVGSEEELGPVLLKIQVCLKAGDPGRNPGNRVSALVQDVQVTMRKFIRENKTYATGVTIDFIM